MEKRPFTTHITPIYVPVLLPNKCIWHFYRYISLKFEFCADRKRIKFCIQLCRWNAPNRNIFASEPFRLSKIVKTSWKMLQKGRKMSKIRLPPVYPPRMSRFCPHQNSYRIFADINRSKPVFARINIGENTERILEGAKSGHKRWVNEW